MPDPWNDSPEYRAAVWRRLENWGTAYRGGHPDLGYPRRQPFDQSPANKRPPYNSDDADAIAAGLLLWSLLARKLDADPGKAKWLQHALALRFASDRPSYRAAKEMGVSRRTYYRILDEAIRAAHLFAVKT